MLLGALLSLLCLASAQKLPVSIFDISPTNVWRANPARMVFTGKGFSAIDAPSIVLRLGEDAVCTHPLVTSDTTIECVSPVFSLTASISVVVSLEYDVSVSEQGDIITYSVPCPRELLVSEPRISAVYPASVSQAAASPLVRIVLDRLVPLLDKDEGSYTVSLAGVVARVVEVDTTAGSRHLLVRAGTATEGQSGVDGDVVLSLKNIPLATLKAAFRYVTTNPGPAVVESVVPMWAYAAVAPATSGAVKKIEIHGEQLSAVHHVVFANGLGECAIDAGASTHALIVCTLPSCAVPAPGSGEDPDALLPLPVCIGTQQLNLTDDVGYVLETATFTFVPPPTLASFMPARALPVNLAHKLSLTEQAVYAAAGTAVSGSVAAYGLDASVPALLVANSVVCADIDTVADGSLTCTYPACAEGASCEGTGQLAIRYPPALLPTGAAALDMFIFPQGFTRMAPVTGTVFFGMDPVKLEVADPGRATLYGVGFAGSTADPARAAVKTYALVAVADAEDSPDAVRIPLSLIFDASDREAIGVFPSCANRTTEAPETCFPGNYHVVGYDASGGVALTSRPTAVAVGFNTANGIQFGLAFRVTADLDKPKFLEEVRQALITAIEIDEQRIIGFSFANYVATIKIVPLARGAVPRPAALVEEIKTQLRLPASQLRKLLPTLVPTQFVGPYVTHLCDDMQYGTVCPAPAPDTDGDDDDLSDDLGIKKLWYIGAIFFIVVVIAVISVIVCEAQRKRRTKSNVEEEHVMLGYTSDA
jgi:hypothetical protein